jgi:hypothetical protein
MLSLCAFGLYYKLVPTWGYPTYSDTLATPDRKTLGKYAIVAARGGIT